MSSPTPIAPCPFHEAWRLQDTAALLKLRQPQNPHHPHTPEHARCVQDIYGRFRQALAGHLVEMAAHGRLNLPDNNAGFDTLWIRMWGDLVTQKTLDDTQVPEITTPLLVGLLSVMTPPVQDMPPDRPSDEHLAFVHNHVVQQVNQGTFPWVSLERCVEHDVSVLANFAQWKPVLLIQDPQDRSLREPLMGEYPPCPPLVHHIIPAPSGELWIMDQFRIDALEELIKPLKDHLPSLNSKKGRLAAIAMRAQQLGMAFFSVGNSSPCIVQETVNGDDVIKIGHQEPNAPAIPSHHHKGYVCTDTWSVSIIDKATLLDKLNSVMPRQIASIELEQFEHQSDNLIKVHVAPGTYHAYASSDPEIFEQHCASPSVNWNTWSEPMGILSSRPISFDALPLASPIDHEPSVITTTRQAHAARNP